MSQRAFMAWLALLGSGAALLFWLLADIGSGGQASIGGGGYDLSDLVYTAALLGLTGLWALAALLLALCRQDRGLAKRAFWLAAIGGAAFLVGLTLHGHHLS